MPRKPYQSERSETSDPFIGCVAGLVNLINTKQVSPNVEKALLEAAQYYAHRNKLSFTPTLAGVVRLAEEAERWHRDHMNAMAARQGRGNVRLTGFDRSTGLEL